KRADGSRNDPGSAGIRRAGLELTRQEYSHDTDSRLGCNRAICRIVLLAPRGPARDTDGRGSFVDRIRRSDRCGPGNRREYAFIRRGCLDSCPRLLRESSCRTARLDGRDCWNGPAWPGRWLKSRRSTLRNGRAAQWHERSLRRWRSECGRDSCLRCCCIAERPISALPIGRSAIVYFLSNPNPFLGFSPAAVVTLVFAVSVLPSLDTVRLVVPISLPPFFRVNSAVLLLTCLAERLS